ncbi:MAG: Eco57I restriction-modification methylase domain-containing protein [Christensenellales bacterium]|jgi:hypothetical protein
MNVSITEQNTRITSLADIIQKARNALIEDNLSIRFSSDETRRIIMICLLCMLTDQKHNNNPPCVLSDFLNKSNLVCLSKDWINEHLDSSSINVEETIRILLSLNKLPDWRKLLNYAYEALEYDTDEYFSIDVKRGVRNQNSKKKKQGIYYTPEDVIDFMVSQCMDALFANNKLVEPSFIDCSCGTGVFLLKVFLRLENLFNAEHDLKRSLQLMRKCIWGVDISPNAIDSCKMVFATYYLDNYLTAIDKLDEIWSILCDCFFVGDSTNLDEVIRRNEKLPNTYDCIIGNPPYVTLGKSSNLFITYVDNMIKYSSQMSCSALVLPLSICYSQGQGFIDLRKKIQTDCACWEFYNFDRSPDSLFGDQVKTRNTILIRKAVNNDNAIYTTRLQRWTSTNRKELFENIELCDITDISIEKRVPKLSSYSEKTAFLQISNGRTCITDLVSRTSEEDILLVLNGTAYNWICAYDHFPPSRDENGNLYVSSTCTSFAFKEKDERDFSIALLSNRIAYWYWTVIGDGFHLNASFLSDYHIGKDDFSEAQYRELCTLGREYCAKIKMNPTYSYNAGKEIVNYSHWNVMDIVERIEEIIINALKLPENFHTNIGNWYINQVQCNRKNGRGRYDNVKCYYV